MDKTKLSEIAYAQIKEDIMNLKFSPGSILYEAKLSRDMDISRTPIRLSLQKLVAEGLVKIKSGKKSYFYVDDLSISTFRDIYQIRTVLEYLSVELASLNRTQEDIDLLKTIIEEQEYLINNNCSVKELLNIDRKFHNEIAIISGNSMLSQQIDKLLDLYYRYNFFALSTNNRFKQAADEHLKILNVIECGNLESVKNLMNVHLSKTNEHILFELANNMSKKDKK